VEWIQKGENSRRERRENFIFFNSLWVFVGLWIAEPKKCLIDHSQNVSATHREYFSTYELVYGYIVVALIVCC
jgi:hypothetical protein